MRTVPWQNLVKGISNLTYAPTKATYQPQFQETIDNVYVFSDYAARGKAELFAKIVSAPSQPSEISLVSSF
jgi:hypothetical protein